MKIILAFLCTGLATIAKSQDITSGYWLPLKRLEQVGKLKMDTCDSAISYPFKKIKILPGQQISLFGFNAADPSVCTISKQKEKGTWLVEDTILHTLYPDYVMGSKIILKINDDTLNVYLTKNGVTFFQKFIGKYGNVSLKDYRETEIGNILIEGKYVSSESGGIVQFMDNGKMDFHSKDEPGRHFISYRFKNYAPESCRFSDRVPRGIVELTDTKGKQKEYFIKRTDTGIDFYTIKKVNRWWDDALAELAFSLSHFKR